MGNRKGYSLIELLGALVIIGLILLVVIPLVSRILTSNDTKEYDNYLKIIESGAKVYADTRIDDLGSSGDTGCIEVSILDLIKEEYIKEFDDKNITCSGNVRINNNNGKIKVSTNISCVDQKNKETFKEENISGDACIAYVPKEEKTLVNQITKNGLGNNGSTSKVDDKTFIKGDNPNNYIWYSGKLWKVVWYDDNTVKLLSNDIITVMDRSNLGYSNSYIDNWLEEVFLPTLKDYNKYLIDSSWDVSSTGSANYLPNKSNVVTSKVGLLNSYEAYNMGNFMDDSYNWLLSNYYGNTVRTATSGGSVLEEEYDSSKYFAIRPAITMKSDVFVISGNGSKNLPYILEGNSTNVSKGTLLNKRLSGEYLKINGELYRIVNITNNLTKVIMVDSIPDKEYDEDNRYYDFSFSSLYSYLKDDWYENSLGEDKVLVFENGAWCSRLISESVVFSDICETDTITSPVGLPSLGDIYTTNNDGDDSSFWTIDFYSIEEDNPKMNVISNDSKSSLSLSSEASVKPVMYLKENVIIKSGKGTKDSPFTLELK